MTEYRNRDFNGLLLQYTYQFFTTVDVLLITFADAFKLFTEGPVFIELIKEKADDSPSTPSLIQVIVIAPACSYLDAVKSVTAVPDISSGAGVSR